MTTRLPNPHICKMQADGQCATPGHDELLKQTEVQVMTLTFGDVFRAEAQRWMDMPKGPWTTNFHEQIPGVLLSLATALDALTDGDQNHHE